MLAIKPPGTYLHVGFLASILAVPRSSFPASGVLLYAPLDPTRFERNLKSYQSVLIFLIRQTLYTSCEKPCKFLMKATFLSCPVENYSINACITVK